MKWFTELKEAFDDRPWMILGKGPSFENFYKFTPSTFNVLALNHVGLKIASQICLFIDLDVFEERLLSNSKFVLAPQHPHVNFKPSRRQLSELLFQYRNKNIYQFKCSTYKFRAYRDKQPVIDVKYNCGEAAFQILGRLGFKEIYSCGIDGGKTYSKHFRKYKPLTNGQPNFDKQIDEIQETCSKFKIKWKCL